MQTTAESNKEPDGTTLYTSLKAQQMQRRQQQVKPWQVSAPKSSEDATQRREFVTKLHILGLEAAYLLPPTVERRPHQG
jgi:hypothetical protein